MAKILPRALHRPASSLRGREDGRARLPTSPPLPSPAGPLPFWEMPDELHARLAEAVLVLTKGDANFRRLLGDLHWPHDTEFADLMREYWPTSLAALRTCKSGVLVGVAPAVEAAAAAAEPEKWLTGGVYGMVSFAPKATSS
mmetsp:Transcript_9809/g.31053  ORF Transcript_9809/g.31053 Transcript_9809/m.31053 type:complete len:142 (+) Transcript_9809:1020-1445(+)